MNYRFGAIAIFVKPADRPSAAGLMHRKRTLNDGRGPEKTCALPRGPLFNAPHHRLADSGAERPWYSLPFWGSRCRSIAIGQGLGKRDTCCSTICHRPPTFAHTTLPRSSSCVTSPF